MVDWFASRESGYRFTGDTLRSVAIAQGLGEPHHPNVWSGTGQKMIQAWIKANVLRRTGHYVKATARSRRGNAMPEYEKRAPRRYVYADEKQQIDLFGASAS